MNGIKNMIGFNVLGRLGRLGNQMFQYAALKGIAKNRGFEYCFPPAQGNDEWQHHQLFNCFKLSSVKEKNIGYITNTENVVSEQTFSFNEYIFNSCPDSNSLFGYFQTEKYFKNIEDEIRTDFQFKDEIFKSCSDMMNGIDDPISLHIRRTDYITNPNHNVLGLNYYEKALNILPKNSNVLIFSDDPKWCKQQELFSDDRFLVSENNSNYVDLCLMSLCKSHIIANSSFSWWGAWLADTKKVVSPKKWFGPNNSDKDTSDIYCQDWIVI
jgi:hypothetical protein